VHFLAKQNVVVWGLKIVREFKGQTQQVHVHYVIILVGVVNISGEGLSPFWRLSGDVYFTCRIFR